jgi:hypothetical protein
LDAGSSLVSDTVPVTVELAGLEKLEGCGSLRAVGNVLLGVYDIDLVLQGCLVRIQGGRYVAGPPRWRHPRTGQWLPWPGQFDRRDRGGADKRDGVHMRLKDVDAVTARLGVLLEGPLQDYVRRLVAREVAPYLARIDELETALGLRPPANTGNGRNGAADR